jgi:hypothetical protein
MRDEDFEYFIKNFGEPTFREAVPELSFKKFQGILPKQLLTYWKEEGWCGHAHGLLWTVDPEQYSTLVHAWLEGTPYEKLDNYHAIARSAFGKLYVWGERNNKSFVISCPMNALIAVESDLKTPDDDPDFATRVFFSALDREEFDLKDDAGVDLFARALEKLGPLGPDEVYGFEPALVAGGRRRLENLNKLNLFIHLAILRQLAAPRTPFAGFDPGPL